MCFWKEVESPPVRRQNRCRQVAHGALPDAPASQYLAATTVYVQRVLRRAEQTADKGLARRAGELESCRQQLAILEVVAAIPPEKKFRRPEFRNDRTIILLHRPGLTARW